MKYLRFSLGSTLFVALLATASMAQNDRSFVSGTGVDTNPCSVTSPCRTISQALSVTNVGGEVVVQSSAGYGAFTISHAVTVVAPPGVYAGITITAHGTPQIGVQISAGSSDTVILRGLTINGEASPGIGILLSTAGTLIVEDCKVNGFSVGGTGIELGANANVFVTNTIVKNNYLGITNQNNTSAGTSNLTMVNDLLDANLVEGLQVGAGAGQVANVAIRNSTASGNTEYGMIVSAGGGGSASLNIESCLLTNNGSAGLYAAGFTGGTGTASISNCTITGNSSLAFDQEPGGTIYSRGNNTIIGSNTGSLTPLAAQ